MKKRKQYDDDDGRVIAPMNVDGMPWYVNRRHKTPTPEEQVQLSREEKRAFARSVIFAALLVCGVFLLGFFLFILFADTVWLR